MISAVQSMSQSTDSLEAGGQLTDDMQEVEVVIKDAKRKKVTTIVQMVTTMIDATPQVWLLVKVIRDCNEVRVDVKKKALAREAVSKAEVALIVTIICGRRRRRNRRSMV